MNPLLINAAELLRRPGSERRFNLEPTIADLGIVDPRFDPTQSPSRSTRIAHRRIMVDGEARRGRIRADALPRAGQRCGVSDVTGAVQQVVTDPDAFEIVGDQIDLGDDREHILSSPVAPLCRPDCAGLCPPCGVDLNAAPCDCVAADVDPRWEALSQLKGNLPEQ